MLRRALLAAALAGSLMLAPTTTPSAEAASKRPAKVSKVRATTNTTSLVIRWKRPKGVKKVAVCVATSPRKRCVRFVRTRKSSVRFRNLKANAGTDYVFRIRSYRGKRSAVTGWRKVNMKVGRGPASRPTAPGPAAVNITWSRATNASSYQLQLSTSRSFTENLRTLNRRGLGAKAAGLNGGMTYYARVRGVNGPVKGPWGPVSQVKSTAAPIRATVATYNLCGEDKCRTASSGSWFLRNVPVWAVRKPYAGSLLRAAAPEIVAAQEAATSTAFHTELPGFTRSAYKSARSIYVKSSRFTALDNGWMTLDDRKKRFGTWSLLRDRGTGTVFYVVNAHLEPYKGAELDQLRNQQTARLIRRMQALNVHGLPIIWAGDWNSNGSNANQTNYPGGFDAPKRRFASIGVVNSVDLAAAPENADLNSANVGVKTPRRSGDHVDAIYVPTAGVRVEAWRMLASFVDGVDGPEYATPFPSDHNPLVARLLIATG